MLSKIKFERFTAFEQLEVKFSPGINIFIGENGTGKTHLMKVAYAACDITKSKASFAEKINNVFLPSGRQIGRLVNRSTGSKTGSVRIFRTMPDGNEIALGLHLSNHSIEPRPTQIREHRKSWFEGQIETVYIPVKDMMANAPGFLSLYHAREIHFEEIYVDILRKAYMPILKGPHGRQRRKILEKLQTAMDGRVIVKNDEFLLHSKHGKLEFTLLAEGYRKLGLLWVLIQNGILLEGSVLFWDEPEANLNPKLIGPIVEILLELRRFGVQIFLATHDYEVLKEFDLQMKKTDQVLFHSLFRAPQTDRITCASTDEYAKISPNTIDDTFGSFIDRDIRRTMGGEK
ncbi:MAG TPA: AAA family ATPase [Planctomycetaceae bacterium]|nr:AAA family ATPase [Planctomycetaceae bacterium]